MRKRILNGSDYGRTTSETTTNLNFLKIETDSKHECEYSKNTPMPLSAFTNAYRQSP